MGKSLQANEHSANPDAGEDASQRDESLDKHNNTSGKRKRETDDTAGAPDAVKTPSSTGRESDHAKASGRCKRSRTESTGPTFEPRRSARLRSKAASRATAPASKNSLPPVARPAAGIADIKAEDSPVLQRLKVWFGGRPMFGVVAPTAFDEQLVAQPARPSRSAPAAERPARGREVLPAGTEGEGEENVSN